MVPKMKHLYHFTSLQTCIEKILPDFSLKANNYNKTNDPRETFLWSFASTNNFNNEFNDNLIGAAFRIGYDIRKNAKVLCFTKEKTGARNEMMWSHYGTNHEGICLEIDEEEFKKENSLIFNLPLVYLENIDYSFTKYDDKPIFSNSQNNERSIVINSFIEKNYPYLFFKKSNYWSKEDERRFVAIIENWDGKLSIRNSLKSIIIGIYCYEKYLSVIEELIKDTDINLKQCIFQIDTPRIKIIKRKRNDYSEHILKKYLKKFNY